MEKKILIVLMMSMLVLPMISAFCMSQINHKIIIDNFNDISENYVLIAHYGWETQQKYNYQILDSGDIFTSYNNSQGQYLLDIYIIEKSKFKGVEKNTVVTQIDTCGNIIINNTPNNSCNAEGYSINGAGYSYPYNFETDLDFISLGISKKDVGVKVCGDESYPDLREDHFKLTIVNGKVKPIFENSIYSYYYYGVDNFLTKTAYPDEKNSIEIITLTNEEIKELFNKREELIKEKKGLKDYYIDKFYPILFIFIVPIFIIIIFILKITNLIRHKMNIKEVIYKNIFTIGLPIIYFLIIIINSDGSCVPSGFPSVSGWLHPFWGWIAIGSISSCVDNITFIFSFINWMLIGLIIDFVISFLKKKK